MREVLTLIASIGVVVFAGTSMLSVGLAYHIRAIVGPLRNPRGLFRVLVANFVLVPLLAVAIERMVPMDPAMALGLFLIAGAAGAPFLVKLASAAEAELALSAALLMVLVPATVVFLPFYVPLATEHPSLRDLSYEPSSILALGLPLLSTMILPLLVGLALKAAAPGWAARLAPICRLLATISLIVVEVAIFLANSREVVRVFRTGAFAAVLLLTVGAFMIGYLIGRRERSVVLGLGTAQRNIAGAMVVASRDFSDPDILVMVTASSLLGLAVLFPIAWLLSWRAPHLGPPTPEPA